ncbi:MAG: hypothetical protein AAGA20_01680, partial [Planctomycetota bacterium]
LLLVVVVYVAFRAWVLATAFDAVAIPVYEVPNMGNQAWFLAEGRAVVPWHYFYDNAGGQILTGVLAAPFYALLGPTYLSLKLVPFLLGIGLLGLVWRFLDRNVGRTAAIVGAFAFALAPPTLSKYSLLAKGNHFEGLFFLFLPVVLAFEGHGRARPQRWMASAGLAAGFAVVVYFGSLLTIALLGPALARLRGLRQLASDLVWIVPGFIVGVAPLAVLHRATDGQAGHFAQRFTTPDPRLDAGGMWAEARSLVVDTLPRGACYEDLGPVPASVGEWLLLGVIAASWIVLVVTIARGVRRRDEASARLGAAAILEAGYLPLVLGVIAVGVLKITRMGPPVEIGGVRYLVSFYFYALLASATAAGALDRMGARRARTALAAALAGTVLFVLPIGSLAFERSMDAVRYPGTFLRNLGGTLQRGSIVDPETGRRTLDAEEIVTVAGSFEGRDRRDVLFSAGNSIAYAAVIPDIDPETRRMTQRPLDLDAVLAPYPDSARPDLARGVGAHLRPRIPNGPDVPEPLRGWLTNALGHPVYGESVAEGLGMSLEYPLRRTYDAEVARTERVLREVPAELRPAVRRGQGIDLGTRLRIGLHGARDRIRTTLAGVVDTGERDVLRTAIESEAGGPISAR